MSLTVLHDIANDAKVVKIPSSPFRAERLFECNLNVINVVAVPGGPKEFVAKSKDQQVLDHLLAQVVVDTENLLFPPVGLECLLEIPGTLKVLAKRFLDLITCQHLVDAHQARLRLTINRAMPLSG